MTENMPVRYLERHFLCIITSILKFISASESKHFCRFAETTSPNQPHTHNTVTEIKATCKDLCLKKDLRALLSSLYKNNFSRIFSFLSGQCMGLVIILNSQQMISLAFAELPGDMFSQYCISAGSELRRKNSLILLLSISLNA